MDRKLKILLLEDNIADAELLMRVLSRADLPHDLHLVETRDHFVSELQDFRPDVVLSDHSLPGFNSMEALKLARAHKHDIPFILVTGSVSEQFAVDCMKAGVDDYILKNSLIRLPSSIKTIFSKSDTKREKEEVESLHAKLKFAYEDIGQINKNILDSLNYAKLLQEAVLPERRVFDDAFNSYFIMYKPKDIVSGDFFWFGEQDGKILVVVADCTGHGVPGALMSMIGVGLLNEIVNVNKITRPKDILHQLNLRVRKALNKNPKEPRYDGMDMALCSIDRKTRELCFAGANRHLVYFRDKEIQLVKGNKFGIGGLHNHSATSYADHTLEYDKGDIVYMFTDGYADQFGGSRGKRMMTRNLFNILHRSLSFGLVEQEKVLAYWLEKWQRHLEQTDDILLMGLEL